VNARVRPRAACKAEARRFYGIAVFTALAAVLTIAAALVANAVLHIQVVS